MKKLFLTIAILFLMACSSDDASTQIVNTCELTVWGSSISYTETPPIKSILYGPTNTNAVWVQVDDYNYEYYRGLLNDEIPYNCWEGILTPPQED